MSVGERGLAAGVTVEAMCIASQRARAPFIAGGAATRAGMADAIAIVMTTKKKISQVLKGIAAAMPALPYIMKSRQRTSMAAYVLGGLGIAVVGGIAALMLFSPRARTKALGAAKHTYGKVNDKLRHVRSSDRDDDPMSNGLVDRSERSIATEL